MRFSVLAGLAAAVSAPVALAFPARALGGFGDLSNEDLAKIEALVEQVKGEVVKKRALGLDALPARHFDPVAQRVDTSGEHRFVSRASVPSLPLPGGRHDGKGG